METWQKWNNFYSSEKREQFLHFTSEQLDSILKVFPSTKSALDIGCGEGQLMHELELRGVTPTGIDPSQVAINNAKSKTSGQLIIGEFEKTDLAGTQYDLIFVKFVLAFIKDYSIFFSKVDSLLNQKGGLIILSPVIEREKKDTQEEEVFVQQSIINNFLPKYFSSITETILYKETEKKLSLYVCKK